MVGEHKDGSVEGRVRAPPAAPLLASVDASPWAGLWGTEFAPAHDLGADVDAVPSGKGVIDAHAATALTDHRAPEPCIEHPLVKTLSSVAERSFEREAVTSAESVERDGEVMYANL
jgi:hypothetical protein